MGDVKWIKPIKAVGFDVDGTLYHSPPELQMAVGGKIVAEAARLLAQDPDELAEEYLKRREQYRSNTMTLNSFGLPGEEIFQKIWNEIPLEQYIQKDLKLVKLMEKLGREYQLFIISNGRMVEIKKKLEYIGLEADLFEPLIACYDQGWIKPEPSPFLLAIESLKLQPEEIVYVGDRSDLDVEGAQATGMRTILIGGPSAGSGCLADECCETTCDIMSVL
ncbi:MAG: HAD family hydrolase [bacterium]